MTDAEIIEMTKQVGIVGKNHTGTGDYMEKFIAFARLIQQKQREIDAQLCLTAPIKTAKQDVREACANAIRSQK